MKNLKQYTDDAISALFEEHKCFFAFNQTQLNEGLSKHNMQLEQVTYLQHNLFCPKEHAEHVVNQMDLIYSNGIKQDIEENGIENIIIRELYNHEAFYTGEIEDTFSSLSSYPVTMEQVRAAYYKELPNS